MFGYEKISLTFSFNYLYLILALILLILYSVYTYRYTIPFVNPARKNILTALRALGLLFVIFIIFEPKLSLAKKIVIKPKTLVFIDNSRSIRINDGTNREEHVKNFIQDISKGKLEETSGIFTFGSKVKEVKRDSLSKINFSEVSTNFSNIFSSIKKDEQNISAVAIISDGVITEGTNPVFTAEKLGIPVFTVGIGDSSSKNDVEIKNVLFNEYIYAGTPTSISVSIANKGFAGKNTNISLYENDKAVEQKSITLNAEGIQNEEFTYTPKDGGEKKLTAVISPLPGEFTTANNKKVFYVNVLNNKLKVVILSGAPSPDMTILKTVLSSDENLKVSSLTYYAAGKTVEKNSPQITIDSADIFFMVGFPSKEVPDDIIKRVLAKNKPFFFVMTDAVDLNKLKYFKSDLAFTINRSGQGYTEVQPNISINQSKNPLLQNNSTDNISAWNNLPPVLQINSEYMAKPEAEVIARVKANNIPLNTPLIITKRIGNKRSVTVLAKDIWRWKLQTAEKDLDLFDRFIGNSVKWLNSSDEEKQVRIKTSKKIYAPGEEIEFAGEVYDELFNPVSDADVTVNVSGSEQKNEIKLTALGNGLYEGKFEGNKPGDYSFSGTAFEGQKKLGNDAGKFNIGEVDIEMIDPKMNYEFLSSLANQTGGKFFNYDNYVQLFEILNKLNDVSAKEKINVNEVNLWSDEWLLGLTIFIFSIEWFIRKRSGML
ncbi:MAG: CARDB domain-containing protein [Ignavibacteriaceae bacterium]|nr:CARDB domain-containing protein [Ignavibacteriaceae bacterium]